MASYLIKYGDTLRDIAARNGTTVQALAAANNISNPDRIIAGTTINIPAGGYQTNPAPGGGYSQQPTPNQQIPGAGGSQGYDADALAFLGFTPQQIQSMSPQDKANWSLTGTYLKQQTDLGNVTAENNALSLQKAYTAALQDPNLTAKYGDLDKSSAQQFANNLQALQTYSDVNQQNNQIQFQQQQKDLSDQYAKAGAAYSGFRNKAKQNLDTQQQGIVTSSIQQMKDALQSQLSPLEQLYGSKGLNNLIGNQSASYLNPITGQRQQVSYNNIGGLTGSLPAQKEADYAAKQQQIYGNIKSP